MKKITYILPALFLVAVAACSPSTSNTTDTTTDTTAVATNTVADTSLTAKLTIQQTLVLGSPIEMTFTVYNKTDSSRTFCKWHTPFEPLMSKYLDITSTTGEEVAYKGPMAKRMMPPPADSYVSVKPGDSLSVNVDLLKAYDLKAAGTYTIKYNAEGISGIKAADSVTFIIK